MCGTLRYIAPEVFKQDYGSKCDMWAIGVILFKMITGNTLYRGESFQDQHMLIQNSRNIANHKDLKNVSDTLVDLLKNLLEKKPKRRITAKEALESDWLNS